MLQKKQKTTKTNKCEAEGMDSTHLTDVNGLTFNGKRQFPLKSGIDKGTHPSLIQHLYKSLQAWPFVSKKKTNYPVYKRKQFLFADMTLFIENSKNLMKLY